MIMIADVARLLSLPLVPHGPSKEVASLDVDFTVVLEASSALFTPFPSIKSFTWQLAASENATLLWTELTEIHERGNLCFNLLHTNPVRFNSFASFGLFLHIFLASEVILIHTFKASAPSRSLGASGP